MNWIIKKWNKGARKTFVATFVLVIAVWVYFGVNSAAERLAQAYTGNQQVITVVPHIEKSK